MHSIDESFRLKKQAALARRKRARLVKMLGALALIVVAAIGGGFYYTADQWSIDGFDGDLVEVEPTTPIDEPPVYVPAIVDLAGDPMMINIGNGARTKHVRDIPRPADLVDPGVSATVEVLSDVMLSTSERLVTTIPSSPEDFAFFQAQRGATGPVALPAKAPSVTASPNDPPPDAAGVEGGDADGQDLVAPETGDTESTADKAAFSDPAAGWGETIDAGEADLPAFKETKVEDTTEVALTTPERMRVSATEDFVDKVLRTRSLESLVLEHGFDPADAKTVDDKSKALFQKQQLDTGFVVAMRGARLPGTKPGLQLVQLSIYAEATYVGTLARADNGAFVAGVDPWVHEDLLHYSGVQDQTGPQREYRLLDAVYSTAIRNNVPSGVIGEAIMFLSRGQDLNAFAAQGDRLVLAYSATARGKDGASGRVLYAAIQSTQKNVECFVYKPENADDYACVTEQDQVYSVTVSNGMVTPVNGVMTSTFGPRKHPILGVVRVHKGVDWAAPVGTPIKAAFDGTIAYHGDGQGYGNVVRITHSGGRETRYAHMSRFADNLQQGMAVKAGDVIGYVGTSGLSTGPHLHFELYVNGEAVDPLQSPAVAVAVAASPAAPSGPGDEAVEILVDKIVRVESGGSATAKNPLSTATGLGQFIEGTWLRMMRTYRPDLARSLGRDELLKLRFDPTLSREMVRRLAQEGEAYLRARGHDITAGRLYLCHFLGMDGAATVLSAGDGADLASVLGQGVISANPFLTGKTVSYVKVWAENKMRVRGAPAQPLPSDPVVETQNVAKASPEFVAYKAAIVAMIKSLANQT